jgi:hypothetical protein
MKGKGRKSLLGVTTQQVAAQKALDNQHQIAATLNAHRQNKKQNNKRRQEDATEVQDLNHIIDPLLPAAKKAKTVSSSDASKPPLAPQDTKATTCQEDTTVIPQSDPLGLLSKLRASCNVTDISVISSTQIKPKVSKILETLSAFSFVALAHIKPNVISARAKGPVASKMITIIEIAKREIAKAGGKWYQYSSLSQVVEEKKEKKSEAMKGKGHILGRNLPAESDAMAVDDGEKEHGVEEGEEEECWFETMKTPLERILEGKPKIRAVPVMTVYLSRVRIDCLERAYGLVLHSSLPFTALLDCRLTRAVSKRTTRL